MRLADFSAILLDIDGTLCAHHRALPGAADVVRYAQSLGKTVALVTNNSASTVQEQVERMHRVGIDVPADRIYTSGRAMADWIRARFTKPQVFNYAGYALEEELGDAASFITTLDEPVDVVCVGTHLRENDVAFDYHRAISALYHLRQGAELLIGSADRMYMFDGLPEFGSGAWGALFAFAADVPRSKLHYAGKPAPEFFLHLCERLNVKPSDCLLVGDNLESDVAGGLSVGMTTALVLTGVATRADLESGKVRPHVVFKDLNEMLKTMASEE